MQSIEYILNSTYKYIFIYFSFISRGYFLFTHLLYIWTIFSFYFDKLQSMPSFKDIPI